MTILGSWIRTRKAILLLLLVVALGSLLRIYGLGAECIWADEAHSVAVSSRTLTLTIKGAITGNHTPLYFVILNFWMGLFGTSEAAVRALSAIVGILSILTIYRIGCALFNSKVGLISSFLSAISLFHIHFAQEARPYSLLMFLSLVSFLFFIQILKQDRKWHYLGYLLTSALMVNTHLFGLLIIAAQIFFLLLFWARYSPQRFKLLTVQEAAIIAVLPTVVLLGGQFMSMVREGFWIGEPSLGSISRTLATFAGGGDILLPIYLCLAVIAPFSVRRMEVKWMLRKPLESLKSVSRNIRLEALHEILLLVTWLFLPIVLVFIVSKLIIPIYVNRYLIEVSPALYLLVAKGLSNLKAKKVIYPVLLIIVLLAVPNLANYYTHYQKQQWNKAAELIELNTQENDVIIIPHGTLVQHAFNYYYQGELEQFRIRSEDTQEIATLVNEATSEKERLWLVLKNSRHPQLPMESYLLQRYGNDSVIMERKFVRVRVLLFGLAEGNTPD